MKIHTLKKFFFALALMATPAVADDEFASLLANVDFGDETKIEVQQAAVRPATKKSTSPLVMPVSGRAQLPVAGNVPAVQSNQFYTASAPIPQLNYSAVCDAGCASQPCAQGGCGIKKSCLKKLCTSCVPHTVPMLPTSTLYQYFKSDACNARVWDGYQKTCGWSAKHSRGECDCFTQKQCGTTCGQVLPPQNCGTSHCLPRAWTTKTGCTD